MNLMMKRVAVGLASPRPLPRSPGRRPLASPGIEFAFTSDAKRVPRDVGVTFLLNCKLLLSMLLQLLHIFATVFEWCLKLNIWLFLAKQGCLVWGHSFLQMIHQVKAIFERCLIIHLLGPHCSLFVSAVTFPRGTFTLCVLSLTGPLLCAWRKECLQYWVRPWTVRMLYWKKS